MRKQRWVRLDKLDYQKHVQDLEKAANQLCRQGFAKQTPLVSELIELLSVDELRQLAKEQQLIQGNGSNKLVRSSLRIETYMQEKKGTDPVFVAFRIYKDSKPIQKRGQGLGKDIARTRW